MLDNNDIKKLKGVFATEVRIKEMLQENNKKLLNDFSEVFATKTDLEGFKQEYRKEFAKALNPLDKKADEEIAEKQESFMLKNKVDRHEKWITKIAKKVEVELES